MAQNICFCAVSRENMCGRQGFRRTIACICALAFAPPSWLRDSRGDSAARRMGFPALRRPSKPGSAFAQRLSMLWAAAKNLRLNSKRAAQAANRGGTRRSSMNGQSPRLGRKPVWWWALQLPPRCPETPHPKSRDESCERSGPTRRQAAQQARHDGGWAWKGACVCMAAKKRIC